MQREQFELNEIISDIEAVNLFKTVWIFRSNLKENTEENKQTHFREKLFKVKKK